MIKKNNIMAENISAKERFNERFLQNNQYNDYESLINRLKEIKKSIVLLEKNIQSGKI